MIRERYPFPISHAYAYLKSRADPEDRYQALLSCFEVTLKTIASIALANFMRDILVRGARTSQRIATTTIAYGGF